MGWLSWCGGVCVQFQLRHCDNISKSSFSLTACTKKSGAYDENQTSSRKMERGFTNKQKTNNQSDEQWEEIVGKL